MKWRIFFSVYLQGFRILGPAGRSRLKGNSVVYKGTIGLGKKRIYRADEVLMDQKLRNQLKDWEAQGYGSLPVCMAKTPYSFSTDPGLLGAPTNHRVKIRELSLSAGAGFLVVICGDVMRMPGLPREPAANRISVNAEGHIEGLF
mgnify:CR=1 FL=1